MAHSRLLTRLLAGQDPLPFPPPTLYRHPAYHLCDGEAHPVREIHTEANIVHIGGQKWQIVEPLSAYQYLLSYDPSAPFFVLDMEPYLPTLQMRDPKSWKRV